MLKTRVITALVAVAVLLAALFYFPKWAWGGLTMLVVLAGCWEWSRLSGFALRGGLAFLSASVLLAALIFAVHLDVLRVSWLQRAYQAVFVTATLFWVVAAPLWLRFAWHPRRALVSGLAGWLVLFPAWIALLLLRDMSPMLLLSVMVIVWIADIAAYFAGRRFGKTRLAQSISPGKTWEGVVGGLIGVMIYFLLWFTALRYFGATWAYWLILYGSWLPFVFLLLGAVSVVGDLFESWMKRCAGVKDSSNLLPGHGGILDRIDALTSALPLAGLFVFVVSRYMPDA
jgi:phosphatidate cytidylyltransferase